MKTATGLALLAVGAILAFAVNADVPGFSLAVTGWILMLTGAAGMFIPARASGWLRRQVILHSPQAPGARPRSRPGPAVSPARPAVKQLDRAPDPAPAPRDPAALAAKILADAQIDPAELQLPDSPADPGLQAELVEEDLAPVETGEGITLQELFGNRRESAS
jgi:hypothetical protein